MLERPLIIGVVGGSGSGKTTVTRAIYDMEGVDAAFVDKPTYDYAGHTRAAATERVEPRHVILVEGILLFADSRLRPVVRHQDLRRRGRRRALHPAVAAGCRRAGA